MSTSDNKNPQEVVFQYPKLRSMGVTRTELFATYLGQLMASGKYKSVLAAVDDASEMVLEVEHYQECFDNELVGGDEE